MFLLTRTYGDNENNGLAFSSDPKRRILEHIEAFKDWFERQVFEGKELADQASLCEMHARHLRPDLPLPLRASTKAAFDKLGDMLGRP